MPLIQRKGAQSSQGFGEFAQSTAATYIEDVFSTYLYTGNGTTQTITNGINLSTKGGLVWIKDRSVARSNVLFDTIRGATYRLISNSTAAQNNETTALGGFNSDGFSTGYKPEVNESGETYVSWTFRKQPKFFDVVTYTGTGVARTIAHNLGSVPGCIITKCTSGVNNWYTYHRSLGNTNEIRLNQTAAAASASVWNSTDPTSTVFSLGASSDVNSSGATYVAYLFAHDAGGFGSDGTQNVITCGSTGGGANTVINLGYEPQFLLYRSATFADDWHIIDNMRGATVGSPTYNTWSNLNANTSAAETSVTGTAGNPNIRFTATGFILGAIAGTAIYIAIRRGPMKTPTVGTSVFSPVYTSSSANPLTVTTNFPVDATIFTAPAIVGQVMKLSDRLRGGFTSGTTKYFETAASTAELTKSAPAYLGFDSNTSLVDNSFLAGGTNPKIYWNFVRAPGFFDEVCFTSASGVQTQSHNLNVVPEFMMLRARNTGSNSRVYSSLTGISNSLFLNTNNASTAGGGWSSAPTSSVFTYTGGTTVAAPYDCVAYLFASCPGVSKVGSYTGTGATQTINCGFTGGARFVIIKRTDSTGDWYVWDTARGMVSGTDPYLLIDTTDAQVNANNVYTTSVGFQIVSSLADINASGGTYLYLAIA